MQNPTADEKKRRAAAESAAPATLMTLQEAADYLRVTRSTIHRMLKRMRFPRFESAGTGGLISRRSTTGAPPTY
jgi:excisionase family DNA binding protein